MDAANTCSPGPLSVPSLQAMLAQMRRYEEEDRAVAAKKAREVQKMKVEILQANEAAIRQRHEVQEKEKEVREGSSSGHHNSG